MTNAEQLDPLRLLSISQAARVLGVHEEIVAALMDRRELPEFRLPRPGGRGRDDRAEPERRKRYTSRLAIEAYQRRVVERTWAAEGLPAPLPVGSRRPGPARAGLAASR